MASEDTAEAIDAMADWDQRFRGISEGTVRNRTRDLHQVFRLLAYEPGLAETARWPCPTSCVLAMARFSCPSFAAASATWAFPTR